MSNKLITYKEILEIDRRLKELNQKYIDGTLTSKEKEELEYYEQQTNNLH